MSVSMLVCVGCDVLSMDGHMCYSLVFRRLSVLPAGLANLVAGKDPAAHPAREVGTISPWGVPMALAATCLLKHACSLIGHWSASLRMSNGTGMLPSQPGLRSSFRIMPPTLPRRRRCGRRRRCSAYSTFHSRSKVGDLVLQLHDALLNLLLPVDKPLNHLGVVGVPVGVPVVCRCLLRRFCCRPRL